MFYFLIEKNDFVKTSVFFSKPGKTLLAKLLTNLTQLIKIKVINLSNKAKNVNLFLLSKTGHVTLKLYRLSPQL